ncbi:MAG: GTP pyrophosphokinase family protein [Lachnospiraceae bacterium]|nr:GTP pyrophosphokinase family protein [Lachnospiraceae bacterium]
MEEKGKRKEEVTAVSGIYGDAEPEMQRTMQEVLAEIDRFRSMMKEKHGEDPVEHCLARIKSEESMRNKCLERGLPATPETALHEIRDAIGIRVVCAFVDDVMAVLQYLKSIEGYEVVCEKDYIRHAKPNGYRSYHLILRVNGFYVEVQLRTISMDTWAALEHQLHYKKNTEGENHLIVRELKRCADELASTDVSMQTIRDMIYSEGVFRETQA